MKNKKLFLLNIVALIALATSIIYVLSVGSHYPLHNRTFFPTLGSEPPETRILMEPEGVVSVENVRLENSELVVDFRALKKGSTTVRISYVSSEGWSASTATSQLTVGFCGLILDRRLIDGEAVGVANFNGYLQVAFVIIGVLLFSEVIMLWSFIDYRRKGEFCYQMIACGGVSIYLAILLLFLIHKVVNKGVISFGVFIEYVSRTGLLLLLALTPIMLVLSLLLMFSNFWLMRHEGRRPANSLGILFGVLWFIGTLLTVGTTVVTGNWDYNEVFAVIQNILIFVIGYFECMFLSTVACAFLASQYKPALDRDYIIILGCGINKDGTLKPLIRGRVDSALRFAKEQFEKMGKPVTFVPSGGKGPSEGTSESEAMARYLSEQGIPEERILREDQSTSTYENMKFSKKVIEAHGGDPANENIAFATTNYHVFRGYIMARQNGFDAKGISAKTKFYFFPNAFLREFIGLIVDRKWQNLIAILFILAFFMTLQGIL